MSNFIPELNLGIHRDLALWQVNLDELMAVPGIQETLSKWELLFLL